jgi:hypothetical protein
MVGIINYRGSPLATIAPTFVTTNATNATAVLSSIAALSSNISNGTFRFHAELYYQLDTITTPLTLALQIAGSPTITNGGIHYYVQNSVTGKNDSVLTGANIVNSYTGGNVATANSTYVAVIDALFTHTSGTAVAPAFASNGASTATILANSWATVTQLA